MADKPQSIGGIWIRESKKGAEYFSISLNGEKYIAFKNNYKDKDSQPDYRIFESKPKDRDEAPF